MESLYRYYLTALSQDSRTFTDNHRGLFLLKPPSLAADAEADGDEDDSKESALAHLDATEDSTTEHNAQPELLREWRVAVLRKVSGFPPFNRIVVGRSRICDVVLPFSSVSKVHAHFHVEEQRVAQLSDHHSRNGTFVNGVRLAPDAPAPVAAGDKLRFGRLDLDLINSAAFYALLHAARG